MRLKYTKTQKQEKDDEHVTTTFFSKPVIFKVANPRLLAPILVKSASIKPESFSNVLLKVKSSDEVIESTAEIVCSNPAAKINSDEKTQIVYPENATCYNLVLQALECQEIDLIFNNN